jgi:hypothetical protein
MKAAAGSERSVTMFRSMSRLEGVEAAWEPKVRLDAANPSQRRFVMANGRCAPVEAPGSFLGWLFGLFLLVGPWVLLETLAPSDLEAWADIYVAGAIGGLALELIRNRWRFEGPSDGQRPDEDAESSFAPYGPLTDVGFLGRMATGAIAAPVFLIIVNALDANEQQSANLGLYLTELAKRPDTYAWGVAVGFSSPAVWTIIEGFVKARGAVADLRLDREKAQAELKKVKAEVELAKYQIQGNKNDRALGTLEAVTVNGRPAEPVARQ